MNRKTINIVGPIGPEMTALDKGLKTIFVDGGLDYKTGEMDCVSIGDNDSGECSVDILLDPEKDRGDLYHAVLEMVRLGFNHGKLYGFVGGRLDHQILLLGDLLKLSLERKISFEIFESAHLRLEIRPSGTQEFTHYGEFSVFTLERQLVSYLGDCKYPKNKEYPQLMEPFSSLGLSNFSEGNFSLEAEKSICVYYLK